MYATSKRLVRESTPHPRLLIYPSRVKLTLLLAGALLFVVAGAFMIRSGGPALTVVGVIAVAFFGSALPYLGYRLIRPRPSVIVDQAGIHDHASVACAGFIPWHEVRRYRRRLIGTQPMLAIMVTDPVALLARVGPPRRMLMKANHRMGRHAGEHSAGRAADQDRSAGRRAGRLPISDRGARRRRRGNDGRGTEWTI